MTTPPRGVTRVASRGASRRAARRASRACRASEHVAVALERGQVCVVMYHVVPYCNGMGHWNGTGRDGTERDGMERNGTEWGGMEWDGMEWKMCTPRRSSVSNVINVCER